MLNVRVRIPEGKRIIVPYEVYDVFYSPFHLQTLDNYADSLDSLLALSQTVSYEYDVQYEYQVVLVPLYR